MHKTPKKKVKIPTTKSAKKSIKSASTKINNGMMGEVEAEVIKNAWKKVELIPAFTI